MNPFRLTRLSAPARCRHLQQRPHGLLFERGVPGLVSRVKELRGVGDVGVWERGSGFRGVPAAAGFWGLGLGVEVQSFRGLALAFRG